jgi:hypothetical protein
MFYSADTLMTYESSFERYYSLPRDKIMNPWTAKDPRKIWHIIYNVPSGKAAEVAAKALEYGAGLVHITNGVMPNPYNMLPDEAYMHNLMNAIGDGGKPAVADPLPPQSGGGKPSPPKSLKVTEADYTSVSLSWTISGDPYAIAVYRFDEEVARLPGYMSKVTIGNLETDFPRHEFKVREIGKDGSQSGFSNMAMADTMPLPGGKPIVNIKVSASPTETVYEADVLVPYAFIRILITELDYECTKPSWPANTDEKAVCAHYMIEGETSYKYTGTAPDRRGNWPWQWGPTAPLNNEGNNMKVERNKYHYRWHLPIGTSTIDTNSYVVQGEGFSPRTDVFMPCPCLWRSGNKVIASPQTQELKYCEGKHDWCPYNCQGDTLCRDISDKWCDKAINNMNRQKDHWYHSNGDYLAARGNCWSNSVGIGCSVQIRGENKQDGNKACKISGDDMWLAYQDIKKIGGCKKCGSKHFGNGCMVSVDYMTECGNRDKGVNRFLNSTDNDDTEPAEQMEGSNDGKHKPRLLDSTESDSFES